jgi:hypothetical protein
MKHKSTQPLDYGAPDWTSKKMTRSAPFTYAASARAVRRVERSERHIPWLVVGCIVVAAVCAVGMVVV